MPSSMACGFPRRMVERAYMVPLLLVRRGPGGLAAPETLLAPREEGNGLGVGSEPPEAVPSRHVSAEWSGDSWVSPKRRKNWLPSEPWPLLAMAIVPRGYCSCPVTCV